MSLPAVPSELAGFVVCGGGMLLDMHALAKAGIPYATLRTRYRRGQFEHTACDVRTRRILLDSNEVLALLKRRDKQAA